MKNGNHIVLIFCLLSLFAFFGCPLNPAPKPTPIPEPTLTPIPNYQDNSAESTYSGSGDEVFHIDTSTDVNLTHTLHLGSSVADVYYVFTNTDPSADLTHPSILTKSSVNKTTDRFGEAESKHIGLIGQQGKPGISAFNEDVSALLGTGTPGRLAPGEPLRDTVGNKVTFYYDKNVSDTVAATCRGTATDGTKTLNIYVADDSWETGGEKTYNVTQTMVNEMIAKFLLAGSENDIYDWVTGIYGEEWGPHSYPDDLITDNNNITILLFDIDDDDVPTGAFIMGYFWAKDNIRASVQPGSNERIMFYIDSVMYACPDGGTWEISDDWPQEILSTLAHEFQHMIHFYQKGIVTGNNGYSSETWINEMCSVIAEDFVADKMLANGPRGVAYDDPTAGDTGNTNGRLPEFNVINDYSLTVWNYELYNYSTVYAFGAYMARNFGGVELFREIVQSAPLDYQSINGALTTLGYSNEDFSSLLQKWGAAILLSDNYSQGGGYYQYNTNAYTTSTVSSITYNLGSINLYNYDYDSQSGPYIYTSSPVGEANHSTFESASNRLYLVGKELTGDVVETVQMRQVIKLTVVVKE